LSYAGSAVYIPCAAGRRQPRLRRAASGEAAPPKWPGRRVLSAVCQRLPLDTGLTPAAGMSIILSPADSSNSRARGEQAMKMPAPPERPSRPRGCRTSRDL